MAKILVVDDTDVNRLILVRLLARNRHQTEEATDGADAMRKAAAAPPDLIITDMLMPTMDGFEFMRKLRASDFGKEIPVIIYTTLQLARSASQLIRDFGVKELLTKPSKPELIIKAVNSALGVQFQEVDPLETVTKRLASILDFTSYLNTESDLQELLEKFCDRLRKVIGAECAFAGIVDETRRRLLRFTASGIDESLAHDELLPKIRPLLTQTIEENRAIRVSGDSNNNLPFNSLLAVPFFTTAESYGWLCLIDRLGITQFGEEEEKICQSLASQFAVAIENLIGHARWQQDKEKADREFTTQIDKSNRERDALSQFIVLDLPGPLRAISQSAGQLLTAHAAALPAEALELAKTINSSAQHLERLIAGLRLLAKIGRKEMELTQIDLNDLAQQIIEVFQQGELSSTLEFRLQPLPLIMGDASIVREIFSQLINNAVKFSHHRRPAVIEIGYQHKEKVFFVKDNGLGFEAQYVEKIFDLFYRVERGPENPGGGIGLAIARRGVERHGGRIWAESQSGQNATFYFTLANAKQANG